MKFFFNSSNTEEALLTKEKFIKLYNQCEAEEADIIVPIGGDGFLLKNLHDYNELKKPFFGINYGSIGFLMNSKSDGDLEKIIGTSQETILRPLKMEAIDKNNNLYGASDLELNISSESDFTISFRRALRENKILRERVLKFTGALPMIFQYNPADFLIEESEKGELIMTICRPDYIAPKIRYNIHDKGHVLQYHELLKILKVKS